MRKSYTIAVILLLLSTTVSAQFTALNPQPTTFSGWSLFSLDANNVWAATNNGLVLKWNGTTWNSGTTVVSAQRFCVWASSASNVYAGGASTGNSLIRFDGTSWSNITVASGWGSGSIRSIWGSSANDVWFTGGASGGTGRVLHFNGTTWAFRNNGLPATLNGQNLFGTSVSNLWLAGSTGGATTGVLLKWNNATSTWTTIATGYPPFRAIWGTDANNMWFAAGEGTGTTGRIYKWNGTTLTDQLPVNTYATLNAIHGSNGSNIWAAGNGGLILKFNGTSWSQQSTGSTAIDFQGIRATGPNAIWAVASVGATLTPFFFSPQATALPLNWVALNIKEEKNIVKLSWTTANEQNTHSFEIQHQQADGSWKNIGTVPAAGFSITPINYNFSHDHPNEGINNYRIVQKDIDSRSSYSKILSINIRSVAAVTVLSNPVENGLLKISAGKAGTAELFDASGKKVLNTRFNAGINALNVAGFAKGIYSLRAGNENIQVVIN